MGEHQEQTQLDFVLQELDQKIDYLKAQSEHHKKMHRFFRYTIFSLAAAATCLSSAAMLWEEAQLGINFVVVIVTAISAVLTSVEGVRRPETLWIEERSLSHRLSDIKRELEFHKLANNSDDLDLEPYLKAMNSVLQESHSGWLAGLESKRANRNKQLAPPPPALPPASDGE